jgi:phage tail sheath protein FI
LNELREHLLLQEGTTQVVTVSGGSGVLTDDTADKEKTTAFKDCLDSVKEIDAVTMILLPEISLDSDNKMDAIYTAALAQCEELMDRMLLMDPHSGTQLDGESVLPTNSSYAALYYPWVKTTGGADVAPSAFAAGVWSRTDSRRGVWKAPAGVETGLLGVYAFDKEVNNAKQGQLNEIGVNVLRTIGGTPVVWGARTLATKANSEWRYIPVRRTFMMVEESVQEGLQWPVFEPNSVGLWQTIKLNIESYLNGLWRSGAFQGITSDQAYFVRCGLGSTMTEDDIKAGKVIIEMGFAPLKPAEFVIIRIQQKVGQA